MEILAEKNFKKAKMKNLSIIEKYKSFNPKKANALDECGKHLEFALKQNTQTLEEKLKLACMYSCQDRFCPMCQWRKQLKYSALIFERICDLTAKKPLRYLFLTLTIKNCHLSDLRATIKHMNQSFQRLSQTIRYKKSILGSIRVLEFTRAKDKTIHPHFHILLAVQPSYFDRNLDKYINQAEFRSMWQSALRADYLPQVNIKIIKPKSQIAKEIKDPTKTPEQAYSAAIAELCKYPMKDTDLNAFSNDEFKELTKQMHNIRNINCGGIFKGALSKKLKELESDKKTDLVHINEKEQNNELWKIIAIYVYHFKKHNDKDGYDYYLHKIKPPPEDQEN